MRAKIWLLIVLALGLLLVLVPACGNNKEEMPSPTGVLTVTPTVTVTTGPTVTEAPTATPSPTPNSQPIKIGQIQDFSGPGAMSGYLSAGSAAVVEYLINEQEGGILGGRRIQFVEGDMRGQTAAASAIAEKLITDDKVVDIAEGGWADAHFWAVAQVTAPAKVLLVDFIGNEDILKQNNWVISAQYSTGGQVAAFKNLLENVLKPKSIGFLVTNTQQAYYQPFIEAARSLGIKIVYEDYLDPGTVDLSPYLTKIKYANPDVLATEIPQAQYIVLYKQIAELGGWGNIKQIASETANTASVLKMPGAEGAYIRLAWLPSYTDPASQAFKNAWAACAKQSGWKYGSTPTTNNVYSYVADLVAVRAIQAAGTDDPGKVAEFARSGKFEVDTPMGHAHFTTEGLSGFTVRYGRVEGGELVSLEDSSS